MKREHGVSLVEVLLAMALIAGGLLSIASMSITALQSVDRSGEETTAIILSQQRMEWLRNHAYDSAATAAGTTNEVLTGEYAGYSRVTVVVVDVPIAGVKTATVTTSSPSGRVVTISSLIAE